MHTGTQTVVKQMAAKLMRFQRAQERGPGSKVQSPMEYDGGVIARRGHGEVIRKRKRKRAKHRPLDSWKKLGHSQSLMSLFQFQAAVC